MFKRLFNFFRDNIRDQEIVLISLLIGFAVVNIPLQHYISLSRFQHYSLAVMSLASGFLLQSVISWQRLTLWGRLTLLFSALYLGCFAYTFWANPWLDWNVTLETDAQTELRHQFANYFAFAGVPLALLWSRWALEKQRAMKEREDEPKESLLL